MRFLRRPRTGAMPVAGVPDYVLLFTVLALVLLGLQAVYSASFVLALTVYDDALYFLKRQALWGALGLGLLAFTMRVPYRWWRLLSPLIMLVSVGLLAAVLVPGWGVERYGATRWLSLGPLPPVEPSEFAKLGLIVYVAAWLSSLRDKVTTWSSGALPFMLLVGLIGGLILLQPDMGTTVVFVLVTGSLFFLAGAAIRHFLLLGLVGGLAGALAVLAESYRLDRWRAFMDPAADPQGIGFHVNQALLALGSGGPFGLGIGASRQKYFYIPGVQTDGVFAVIGEEIGFVGSVFVLSLLVVLALRCFRLVAGQDDRFASLLVAGVMLWLAFQTLVNLGGVTKVLPLTGVPLPFLSYGGSALATQLAAMGIVLNVSRYHEAGLARAQPSLVTEGAQA